MKYDVLMIIKTIGLEYDDRLKKECLSIYEKNKNLKIIVLDDSSKKEKGVVYESIPYKKIKSFSRRILPHRRFLIIKFLEMTLRFIVNIISNRAKVVWIHNFESILLIPFLVFLRKIRFIEKIIWDQHELIVLNELPFFFKGFFKYGMNKVDYVIHANDVRKKYLVDNIEIEESKIKVIENFVDKEFSEYSECQLPSKVKKWLKEDSYYLAQGGASTKRNFISLAEAFIKLKKRLIVIGPIQDKEYLTLKKEYIDFDDYIYFTGMIPQIDIIPFIDHAKASIIFYSFDGGLNFIYCAPNRLYQAISRSTPIIVGNNPTMKEIVDKYECGICTGDEGNNSASIVSSVKEVDGNYDIYKSNSEKHSKEFNWEKNDFEINKILA